MSDGAQVGLLLAIVFLWSILAALVAYAIGRKKGRAGLGIALGLILGWIGVIVIAAMGPSDDFKFEQRKEALELEQRKARFLADAMQNKEATRSADIVQCPFCAEDVRAAAIKCKHCGESIPRK